MTITLNKTDKISQKAKAVADAVIEALTYFSEQNSEFKQAVEQNSHTLAELLEKTVEDAGISISDLEVYKKAVAFIFPGADVKFNMTIDLGDGGFSNTSEAQAMPKNALVLDFDSLFD